LGWLRTFDNVVIGLQQPQTSHNGTISHTCTTGAIHRHRSPERNTQAAALNSAGSILLALGRLDTAHARHTSARDLAVEIGDRLQHAKALDGIAHCLNKTGGQHEARRHWRRAVEIYTALGVPDAAKVPLRLP
jgi:hypothetical protein